MKELLFASALLVSLPSILFAEQIIRDQTGRIIESRDTVGGSPGSTRPTNSCEGLRCDEDKTRSSVTKTACS